MVLGPAIFYVQSLALQGPTIWDSGGLKGPSVLFGYLGGCGIFGVNSVPKEGSHTPCLKTLVPRYIPGLAFGARVLE